MCNQNIDSTDILISCIFDHKPDTNLDNRAQDLGRIILIKEYKQIHLFAFYQIFLLLEIPSSFGVILVYFVMPFRSQLETGYFAVLLCLVSINSYC